MKTVGWIFRILIALLFAAAGVALLIMAMVPDYRDHYQQLIFNVLNSRLYLTVSGVLLLLIWLLAYAPLAGRRHSNSVMAFSTADGPVTVALTAVQDYVKGLCASINGVREVREVRIVQSHGGIEVYVVLLLRGGVQVPQVISQCTQTIKQRLKQTFGFDKIHQVPVKIEQVESERVGKSSEPYFSHDEFPAFRPEPPREQTEEPESSESEKL